MEAKRSSAAASLGHLDCLVLILAVWSWTGIALGCAEAVRNLSTGAFLQSISSIFAVALGGGVYALLLGIAGVLIGFPADLALRKLGPKNPGAPSKVVAVQSFILVSLLVFVVLWHSHRGAPPDSLVLLPPLLSLSAKYATIALVSGVVVGGSALWSLRRADMWIVSAGTCWFRIALIAALVFCVTSTLGASVHDSQWLERRARSQPAISGQQKLPSIILLTIDTLRNDHLEMSGYPRPTSPHLSKLADRGTRWTAAIASAPWTAPASGTILTGLPIARHGVDRNSASLADDFPTIAALLRDHGYDTAAFVENPFIGSRYGFARGFDVFVEINECQVGMSTLYGCAVSLNLVQMLRHLRGEDGFIEAALGYLRWRASANRRGPYFVWVHILQPHSSYTPPPQFYERFATGARARARATGVIGEITRRNLESDLYEANDAEWLQNLYDAEILYADHAAGALLSWVDTQEELPLVIFTADHGEVLTGRFVNFTHTYTLFADEVNVPLVFTWPGTIQQNREIPALATHADILPTIADMILAPRDPRWVGQSLYPVLLGEADWIERPAFSQNRYATAIIQRPWKLILKDRERPERGDNIGYPGAVGSVELYNFVRDPLEQDNRAGAEPIVVAELMEKLGKWRASNPRSTSRVEIDERTREKLEALGYIE